MKLNLGFGSLLTLIFVIAKLCGAVTWSWGIVFLPMIISAFVVIFLLVLLIALVAIGGSLR